MKALTRKLIAAMTAAVAAVPALFGSGGLAGADPITPESLVATARKLNDDQARFDPTKLLHEVTGPGPIGGPLLLPARPTTTCPAAIIITARGSGQKKIAPSRTKGGVSLSGWEGQTLRPFVSRITDSDIGIMSLGDSYYAAWPFWTEPLILGVRASAVTGAFGVLRAVVNYEDVSGCHPDYILIGYSQGAMTLALAERIMALNGRVAGAIYIGDPWLDPKDPTTIGSHGAKGTLFRRGPLFSSLAARVNPDVVEYCITGDAVCDDRDDDLGPGIITSVSIHRSYFRNTLPGQKKNEDAILARLEAMIARSRARQRENLAARAFTPPLWRALATQPKPGHVDQWLGKVSYETVGGMAQFIDDNVLRIDRKSAGQNASTVLSIVALIDAYTHGGLLAVTGELSSAPGAFSTTGQALSSVADATIGPTSMSAGTNLSASLSGDVTLSTTLSTATSLSTGLSVGLISPSAQLSE